jgi:branched-subunit amino acid transport protein
VIWWAVLAGAAGCYLFKLAGLSVPARLLSGARVRALSALLPVALLTALIAVQVFTDADGLTVDARAGGLLAAVVALLLRAPFLAVVVIAAATTAVLRAVS